MSVSMRMMRAGDGHKYLLRTVAAADGERSLSTPLTRYYAEAGRDGAVAQVEVTGFGAAGVDHFDSRAGDPHLHTHVVVSNG